MAVMWPRALPPEVLANTLRNTECQVYRRLEAVLDDSFVVFYSRPWLGLKPDGEEIDGECDFIIAHAELGLLALEVKGGAIAFDPLTDKWTSKDRWGFTHNIKNPVQQARSSKHELLQKLKNSSHWKSRYIRARHGVILPHSAAPAANLGADMPHELFCFLDDFEHGFRDWILRRFGEDSEGRRDGQGLGRDGIRALEKILAYPFQLRTPLGCVLASDDKNLHVLTQQQFHILRAIEDVKRAAVCGGAGTGKTVLAAEEARRCANNGWRTLFVCFNRGLAVDVQRRLGDVSALTVKTFHALCSDLSVLCGIAPPAGSGQSSLYDHLFPELLMQAFEQLPDEKFDAIIVDEGQDFFPLWWTAIDAGLNPDGQQALRIFYDNNQRIYKSTGSIPKDVSLIPIRLTINLRNTKRIHEIIQQHYQGHVIEAVGPEGVEVSWITVQGADAQDRQIKKHLTRLTTVERVSPGDIAVLFSTDDAAQSFSREAGAGNAPFTRCDTPHSGSIVIDTVRRFKGLERSVVIVAVSAEMVLEKELPYVAVSRARTHLILVGQDKVLDRMRGGFV